MNIKSLKEYKFTWKNTQVLYLRKGNSSIKYFKVFYRPDENWAVFIFLEGNNLVEKKIFGKGKFNIFKLWKDNFYIMTPKQFEKEYKLFRKRLRKKRKHRR